MWNCRFLLKQAQRPMELLPILNRLQENHFVMPKSTITSTKELTLLQWELTAAMISTRLDSYLQGQLHESKVYLWSNSQIVLQWLRSTKELTPFISYYAREIKERISVTTWKYCPTLDNPADLLTRCIKSQQLTSSHNLETRTFLATSRIPMAFLVPIIVRTPSPSCQPSHCRLNQVLTSSSQTSAPSRSLLVSQLTPWNLSRI